MKPSRPVTSARGEKYSVVVTRRISNGGPSKRPTWQWAAPQPRLRKVSKSPRDKWIPYLSIQRILRRKVQSPRVSRRRRPPSIPSRRYEPPNLSTLLPRNLLFTAPLPASRAICLLTPILSMTSLFFEMNPPPARRRLPPWGYQCPLMIP